MSDVVQHTTWEMVEGAMERLDAAMAGIDALDESARTKTLELKEALEDFYGATLRQIVRVLKVSPHGEPMREQLLMDPMVATAFSLRGLVQPTLAQDVVALLELVRPQLSLQGAEVVLASVDASRVKLRCSGSAAGCGAGGLQRELTELILSRIEGCGEVVFEEADRGAEIANHVADQAVALKRFVTIGLVSELPESRCVPVTVGTMSLILVKVEGKVSCFRNECAHQGRSLEGAQIEDCTLTCRWHGFRFDAHSGEGITIPGVDLEVVPLRIRDDRIQVASPW